MDRKRERKSNTTDNRIPQTNHKIQIQFIPTLLHHHSLSHLYICRYITDTHSNGNSNGRHCVGGTTDKSEIYSNEEEKDMNLKMKD